MCTQAVHAKRHSSTVDVEYRPSGPRVIIDIVFLFISISRPYIPLPGQEFYKADRSGRNNSFIRILMFPLSMDPTYFGKAMLSIARYQAAEQESKQQTVNLRTKPTQTTLMMK